MNKDAILENIGGATLRDENGTWYHKDTVLAAMEEYASQQPSLRWTKKELKELISLAEDGYRLHVSNACHQEFLSEDLDILDRAKKLLSESTPTPKQESAVSSAVKKVCGTHCDWPNCTLPECVVNKSPKQEDEYKIALQWYKQGIEDAGESIGDGIDADFYDQYGEQFKQSLPKQSQDELWDEVINNIGGKEVFENREFVLSMLKSKYSITKL